MNREERRAAATSSAAAVVAVNSTVADVGSAVRRRVRPGLAPLGPAGSLTLSAIDGHTRAVHSIVALSARVAGAGVGAALAATADPAAPTLDTRPRMRAPLAGLRAAFGDTLPEALAPGTVLVSDDRTRDQLVVFVHGLGGHDQQWHPDYAATASRLGFDSVSARYTTGRAIAESGLDLSQALDRLVGSWPVDVRRLVLVGHSMGGLVISEAIRQTPDATWVPLVSDVVTLGSPFLGAPLERVARTALKLAARSSVAAPIVRLGDHRSVGIKDLGDGIPSAPGPMRHHAVVATLGKTPTTVVSRVLGDGLVPPRSADSPRGGAAVTVSTIPDAHHLDLLTHPEVTRILADVLSLPATPDHPPGETQSSTA